MKEFFTEPTGTYSLMRLMSFITLLASIGLASVAVYLNSDMASTLAMLYLGTAFGGKLAQKPMEAKV